MKERGAAAGLQRTWYSRKRTLTATLLRPLSWVFATAAATRRAAFRANIFRRVRVPVPVIVVGNITVGGSGKTPLVAALVEALSQRGRHPGIVSRGHGRRTSDTREVHGGDDALDVGDEPLLLAASGVPVFIGRDRVAAAQALLTAHPDVDVLVADDGLQHYALARDVEFAVIDSLRELGNELLLPAGPLREPPSRLASVDAIVWRTLAAKAPARRRHPVEFAMTLVSRAWMNLRDPTLAFDPAVLTDPSSVAIAGIAHPAQFFDGLNAIGFTGVTRAFPDHHRYTRDDVSFPRARAILMTEKDAVKCRAFADARMWMLPIGAHVDPALIDYVLEKIDGPQAPRNARLPGHQGPAHL
ncbi:MAG: tetraacyldisaccharide 4'-kinase [Pseudomonadota bacterium]|nr:tetraacyldisaccharide 4'-kinase [Pseudomonadota bacterium]